MATFALYVQSDCFCTPTLAAVQRFMSAALSQGHQIDHVFFYQDAVYALSAAVDLPADEPHMAAQLAEFAQKEQIELLYCVTAAEKRGVATSIKPALAGYTAAGLAEFAMRIAHVDRVIQF